MTLEGRSCVSFARTEWKGQNEHPEQILVAAHMVCYLHQNWS